MCTPIMNEVWDLMSSLVATLAGARLRKNDFSLPLGSGNIKISSMSNFHLYIQILTQNFAIITKKIKKNMRYKYA